MFWRSGSRISPRRRFPAATPRPSVAQLTKTKLKRARCDTIHHVRAFSHLWSRGQARQATKGARSRDTNYSLRERWYVARAAGSFSRLFEKQRRYYVSRRRRSGVGISSRRHGRPPQEQHPLQRLAPRLSPCRRARSRILSKDIGQDNYYYSYYDSMSFCP